MRTAKATGGSLQIPVIDISGFDDGGADRQAAIAALVDRAARDVGFIQIQGHGIPQTAADGLAEAMDGFFALPFQEKSALKPPTPAINRGYTAPRGERLSYSLGIESAADLFEAYNVGVEAAQFPDLELHQEHYPANMWPNRPAMFERNITEWMRHASELATTLTRVFAVALDLPANYFHSFTDHAMDTFRMNRYQIPDSDARLEPGQLGMGPHTDYGVLTVLWADDVLPGLQILDSDGGWHDVLPAPGALLINLGDVLARWTNDRWLSTMHRVQAPITADGKPLLRRSAAYFHEGNPEAIIDCLPTCAGLSTPSYYEPISVADHLAAKLAGSRSLQLNQNARREAARLPQ